jgi:hypothetical protein
LAVGLIAAGLGVAILRSRRVEGTFATILVWIIASPFMLLVLLSVGSAWQQLFGRGWHGALLR